jgi:phage gp29-like protein
MGTFSNVKNWIASAPSFFKSGGKHSISNLLGAFQFSRLKHDISMWRDALTEMELTFYPYRVKAQRIYIDTKINSHVHSCYSRRYDLVLLKKYGLYRGEECDDKATEKLSGEWVKLLFRYALEADLDGYSLIELGDMINDSFPNLRLIPRENISPDREMLASYPYQIAGENFNDPSNPYYNWVVWVKTPSDKGTSKCGYGLLYKVANLEIFLRNLLGSNANYNDRYGQPIRHAKTSKLEGPEYDALVASVRDMGENGWLVTDNNDELLLVQAQTGNGAGFKTYENFEARLEKKISKVLLGHSDALDSTAGKLGGDQGGEESPASKALEDLETTLAEKIENLMNDQVIPKLLAIGFPIEPGLKFKFKNDKEKEEIREKKDKSLQATATAIKTFNEAGWEVDEKWLQDHTDIKITKKEDPEPLMPGTVGLDPKTKEKIKNLYNV